MINKFALYSNPERGYWLVLDLETDKVYPMLQIRSIYPSIKQMVEAIGRYHLTIDRAKLNALDLSGEVHLVLSEADWE